MKILTIILVSFISLMSVSLLIPSYMALESFSTEFENTVTADIANLNSNTLDKINRDLNNRIFDIQLLSSVNNPIFTNLNSIEEKIEYLRHLEKYSGIYASSSFYDIDGIKLGDTKNLLIGLDESSKKFFVEAKSGKIYYDSIPVLSDSLGIPVMHFSGPTHDVEGNIDGVVVLRYPISNINEIVQSETGFSKKFNVDLMSVNGEILYSNHQKSGSLSDALVEFAGFTDFVLSDASSTFFFSNTIDHPTKESLFVLTKDLGYSNYAGGNWIMISEIETDILFSEERRAIFDFILFSGAVLVIAIILSVIIAHRISRPLTKLRIATQRIAESKSREKIKTKGHFEVQELTTSFNNMIDDLNKIDTQKQEFMSMVSHELKTPLTPIMLYADMLKKGLQGELSEQQLKSVEHIYTNSTILLNLISDVLDVNKLELKELILKKEILEVNTFLRKSIRELESFTKAKNINISLEVLGSWTVKIDPSRILQVLSNLIKNSVDFVPDSGGKITIKAEKSSKNKTTITVSDNGVGISKKDSKHLFQKFYQIDSSLSRSHGGTGLGLTICQGIVEAHGGKIWFDHTYTSGASFKFTIPNS